MEAPVGLVSLPLASSEPRLARPSAVLNPDDETPPVILWGYQDKKPSRPAGDTSPVIRSGRRAKVLENYQDICHRCIICRRCKDAAAA
ncbi:hypothetical protein V8F33_013564 [Rhypophila sp. PSN 637]